MISLDFFSRNFNIACLKNFEQYFTQYISMDDSRHQKYKNKHKETKYLNNTLKNIIPKLKNSILEL